MIIVTDKCGRNCLLRPGDILNICRGNKDERSQNFRGDNCLLFLLFVIFLRLSFLCITSFCFHIYNRPPSEKKVLCHSSYTIYFQYLAFLLAMSSYTGRKTFFYGVGCLNLLLWRSKCILYVQYMCMYKVYLLGSLPASAFTQKRFNIEEGRGQCECLSSWGRYQIISNRAVSYQLKERGSMFCGDCENLCDRRKLHFSLKVVTNEKGEAVGDVLTIIC
jgi:hypothetical protein